MAMLTLVAGGWNLVADPDANTLFSSHTVQEIRQIEQKTRYCPLVVVDMKTIVSMDT